MRDLLYKNLTSSDRKRRIISSSETIDKNGVHSVVRRHFVCLIKEVKNSEIDKPEPYLYVLKKRDTVLHKERFFCRMKGSIYCICKGKTYVICYTHSLSINLEAKTNTALKN
jgi:hypothetical protein